MHEILNELEMRECLKTCYKILNLVLLVFTDLNLELVCCFAHF